MNQEKTTEKKSQSPGSRKVIVLSVGVSLVFALTCFVVLAVLPASEGPPLEDPLRSLLTGLGVLGVAAPLCIAGFALKKRFASSPYYEGNFIATVLSVSGFVCLAAGLACIILGTYDWIARFLESTS